MRRALAVVHLLPGGQLEHAAEERGELGVGAEARPRRYRLAELALTSAAADITCVHGGRRVKCFHR